MHKQWFAFLSVEGYKGIKQAAVKVETDKVEVCGKVCGVRCAARAAYRLYNIPPPSPFYY